MKHTKSLLLILALAPLVLSACGEKQVLSADAVDATLVDANTGQPLANVPVVAYWELKRGSFTGDSLPCGAANVEEAVTDKDGKFHIPGWGPMKDSCGHMGVSDPRLFAFKSGYMPLMESNAPRAPYPVYHSISGWNGLILKMTKDPAPDLHDIGAGSYESRFDQFNFGLETFIVNMPKECNWQKVPNMLRVLNAEQQRFNAAGTPNGSVTSRLVAGAQSIQEIAPQCGSPKAFVEGLLR